MSPSQMGAERMVQIPPGAERMVQIPPGSERMVQVVPILKTAKRTLRDSLGARLWGTRSHVVPLASETRGSIRDRSRATAP